jgi:SAM-dependent methyltransferase
VDFSSEFIAAANRRLHSLGARNAHFHCCTIGEFCDNHVGVIDKAFAFDFTEHVYDEELTVTLASIRRSLKKNGRLFAHTPNGGFVIERLKAAGVLHQFPEHVAVRRKIDYVRLFRAAGFTRTVITCLAHYNPILKFMHVLHRVPGIGDLFASRLFIEAVP